MSRSNDNEVTDEEVMKNLLPHTLYSHTVKEHLKCFQVVFQEKSEA